MQGLLHSTMYNLSILNIPICLNVFTISVSENLHKLKKLEYLKLGLNNIERIENLEGE